MPVFFANLVTCWSAACWRESSWLLQRFPLSATGLAKAASVRSRTSPGRGPAAWTWHLYAADGSLITSFYDENRELARLSDVPQVMRDAMVAAEDVRFYELGRDMQGVIRAFIANQQSARSPRAPP